MKELNELELKEVEGGSPKELFFIIGPTMYFSLTAAEFIGGFVEGWVENKL
jgi:bacteriocin-like protein